MEQPANSDAQIFIFGFVVLIVVYALYQCFFASASTTNANNNAFRTPNSKAGGKKVTVDPDAHLSPEALPLKARLFSSGGKRTLSLSIDKKTLFVLDKTGDIPCNLDKTLQKLNEIASVFVLLQADSDEEQKRLEELLRTETLPSFTAWNRILFYGSETGKVAMLRQLKPKIHIEWDRNTHKVVAPHIDHCVFLDPRINISHNLTANPSEKTISSYDDILYLDCRV